MDSKPTNNFVDNPSFEASTNFGSPVTSVGEGVASNNEELKAEIVEVIKNIFDPEIPVNIYDLGLIYDIAIPNKGEVQIKMTLTSPACPVAGSLPPEVETKVKSVPGVDKCVVELVWDPPWDKDKMTEAARLQLNLF